MSLPIHPMTLAAFADEIEKLGTAGFAKKYLPAAAVGSAMTIAGNSAMKDWKHGRRDRLQMQRQQQLQRLQQQQQMSGAY